MINTKQLPTRATGDISDEYEAQISWVNTACVLLWVTILAMYVVSLRVV